MPDACGRGPWPWGPGPTPARASPEGPNGTSTLGQSRQPVVAATGARAAVTSTTIVDQHQVERRGFPGSPTILVDGSDPFARSDRPAPLACRLYPTSDGLRGIPPLPDLEDALERAAAGRARG